MQNSLAVIGDSEWQVMQQQADALVKSGFLPQSIKTAQQAVAIIMLGRELGIAPWASLSTINVIQGKPTVSPQLMLALINRSGQLEDMQVADDGSECTVTMRRRGRSAHSFTFSMADAQAMALSGKDNWKKQPAIMRQWRAVAGCARVVFADVILGLYTPEEMGAEVVIDGEGNQTVIDVAPVPVKQLQDGVEAQTGSPKDAGASSSSASTPAGTTGASTDQFDRDFPPHVDGAVITPLNTEGDDQHLPRKNDLPLLGSLNMVDILNAAVKERLVRGKEHFANLIDLLWREGTIRAASEPDVVLEAMRQHQAHKDMEREAVSE